MTARTLEYPDPDDASDFVAEALDREDLVTAFGRCAVDYDGRAASELGPGDRHLTLKPDGTALVHSVEGHQPVNWQPPGAEHAARVDGGEFVVESVRTSPDERLVVRFGSVVHLAAFDASDGEELTVSGTEADLKERVLSDPEVIEPGFQPLATERDTRAGAVDVYGEDRDGNAVVVELKRRRVGPDAVGQLGRYVEALRRELHADADVRGILAAPSVTDRAHRLLATEGFEFVELRPEPDGPSDPAP